MLQTGGALGQMLRLNTLSCFMRSALTTHTPMHMRLRGHTHTQTQLQWLPFAHLLSCVSLSFFSVFVFVIFPQDRADLR